MVTVTINYADSTVTEEFKKVVYEQECKGQFEEFSVVYDGNVVIDYVPYIELVKVVDTLTVTIDFGWVARNYEGL